MWKYKWYTNHAAPYKITIKPKEKQSWKLSFILFDIYLKALLFREAQNMNGGVESVCQPLLHFK